MQVGIIGASGSGKSTLFKALTGRPATISGKKEIVRGIAEVPDKRVDILAEAFNSRKKTFAVVEYIDAPPIETGGLKRESYRKEFLRGLEQTDALLLVVPVFLPGQKEDTVKAAEDIETEFILSDIEILEKRLERLDHDLKRGVKGDLEFEKKLLNRCLKTLEEEKPLHSLEFTDDEMKRLRSFSFLTLKHMLIVLNISEEDLPNIEEIREDFMRESGRNAVAICAEIQAEISELPEEEIPEFLAEMGISERARDKILRKTREILNLITFLTVGEEESRAWDLRKGSTASKAAGTVHTDMEKGFICAETFTFDKLENCRSYGDLRSAGELRLEGRDYVVKDGDVMLFRFNI